MKINIKIICAFLICIFLSSCCYVKINQDEKYQPLGTAVLAANDLLLVKYSQGQSEYIQGDDYKELLKENYTPMYDRLLPYIVQIKRINNNFIVSVFDDQKLILTDWLCTEGRIDCWSYNEECNPDKLKVKCDREMSNQ